MPGGPQDSATNTTSAAVTPPPPPPPPPAQPQTRRVVPPRQTIRRNNDQAYSPPIPPIGPLSANQTAGAPRTRAVAPPPPPGRGLSANQAAGEPGVRPVAPPPLPVGNPENRRTDARVAAATAAQATVVAPPPLPSGVDGVDVNDVVVSATAVPAQPQATDTRDSAEERDPLNASDLFASYDPLGDNDAPAAAVAASIPTTSEERDPLDASDLFASYDPLGDGENKDGVGEKDVEEDLINASDIFASDDPLGDNDTPAAAVPTPPPAPLQQTWGTPIGGVDPTLSSAVPPVVVPSAFAGVQASAGVSAAGGNPPLAAQGSTAVPTPPQASAAAAQSAPPATTKTAEEIVAEAQAKADDPVNATEIGEKVSRKAVFDALSSGNPVDPTHSDVTDTSSGLVATISQAIKASAKTDAEKEAAYKDLASNFSYLQDDRDPADKVDELDAIIESVAKLDPDLQKVAQEYMKKNIEEYTAKRVQAEAAQKSQAAAPTASASGVVSGPEKKKTQSAFTAKGALIGGGRVGAAAVMAFMMPGVGIAVAVIFLAATKDLGKDKLVGLTPEQQEAKEVEVRAAGVAAVKGLMEGKGPASQAQGVATAAPAAATPKVPSPAKAAAASSPNPTSKAGPAKAASPATAVTTPTSQAAPTKAASSAAVASTPSTGDPVDTSQPVSPEVVVVGQAPVIAGASKPLSAEAQAAGLVAAPPHVEAVPTLDLKSTPTNFTGEGVGGATPPSGAASAGASSPGPTDSRLNEDQQKDFLQIKELYESMNNDGPYTVDTYLEAQKEAAKTTTPAGISTAESSVAAREPLAAAASVSPSVMAAGSPSVELPAEATTLVGAAAQGVVQQESNDLKVAGAALKEFDFHGYLYSADNPLGFSDGVATSTTGDNPAQGQGPAVFAQPLTAGGSAVDKEAAKMVGRDTSASTTQDGSSSGAGGVATKVYSRANPHLMPDEEPLLSAEDMAEYKAAFEVADAIKDLELTSVGSAGHKAPTGLPQTQRVGEQVNEV